MFRHTSNRVAHVARERDSMRVIGESRHAQAPLPSSSRVPTGHADVDRRPPGFWRAIDHWLLHRMRRIRSRVRRVLRYPVVVLALVGGITAIIWIADERKDARREAREEGRQNSSEVADSGSSRDAAAKRETDTIDAPPVADKQASDPATSDADSEADPESDNKAQTRVERDGEGQNERTQDATTTPAVDLNSAEPEPGALSASEAVRPTSAERRAAERAAAARRAEVKELASGQLQQTERQPSDEEPAERDPAVRRPAEEQAEPRQEEREKAEQERADRERAEKEQAEEDLAVQRQAAEEQAERQQVRQDRADRQRAEKEQADRQQAEQRRADQRQAEQRRVEQLQGERDEKRLLGQSVAAFESALDRGDLVVAREKLATIRTLNVDEARIAAMQKALGSAIAKGEQSLTDEDMDTVLTSFNSLARAIESGDQSAMDKLTVTSNQNTLFSQLLSSFEAIDIDIVGVRVRNASKTVSATLRIRDMERTNGAIATPSESYRDRVITSRRNDGEWSLIEW